MGKLIYEDVVRVDFDDRLLAHLHVVIGSKLRRNEPFFLNWREDAAVGGGRKSVWVHAGSALVFVFSGDAAPALSREWLDALMRGANSAHGLTPVPDHDIRPEADQAIGSNGV